ncbi:MAG: hypothetical protein LQ350_000421 [Teloschistes chrysophthalmus]|nr:MAG: hypothetical protein LQ350_000421 [Niorma chrysophthalma]
MCLKNSLSHILYQNQDSTVILIDIPRSISSAQGIPDSPCSDALLSSPPLENSYASIEPRSKKARERVQQQVVLGNLAEPSFPPGLLLQGLAEIKSGGFFKFCSERKTSLSATPGHGHDRGGCKSSELVEQNAVEPGIHVSNSNSPLRSWNTIQAQGHLTLSSRATASGPEAPQIVSLQGRVISNPLGHGLRIHSSVESENYRVPPRSTFLLSQVGEHEASGFSKAARKLLPEPSLTAAPGQFDFILLDPPWDNKSVRRGGTYKTQRKAEEDPLLVLEEMLGSHVAPGAIVACWITNKKSVRATALRLFESWGVTLIEEWAWLKTTIHGEPIVDVEGIMRRPYEVLLVGRSMHLVFDDFGDSGSVELAKKRVVVGVPDLHSRKPCFKTLIEPMLKDKSNYRALEIFARHLVAGWWSWGDEVLKYNGEGYWVNAES